MHFWSRQVAGWVSRMKIPTRTTPITITTTRLLFHTQTIHWRPNDDDEIESSCSRCRLISFRPSNSDSDNSDSDSNNPLLHALTVNDSTSGKTALRSLRKGQALVYTGGDYHNARQLLQAIKRKCGGTSGAKRRKKRAKEKSSKIHDVDKQKQISIRQQWIEQKKAQREQSKLVNKLLIQVSLKGDGRPNEIIGLKRAPANAKEIFSFAFQNEKDVIVDHGNLALSQSKYFLLSLNDFLAMVGGYEWYRKGVYIHALQAHIFPHFGVFPPTRQDYIPLLDNIKKYTNVDRRNKQKKTQNNPIRMLEVGIGSGVLSLLLLKQNKVDHVTGTDINSNAIACAKDNVERFGFDDKVDLVQTDLFPPRGTTVNENNNDDDDDKEKNGKFDIVLFNPPWIPGDATSWLDRAVYDSDQSLVRRFLSEVQHHVNEEDGHVYLLLSNLGILLELFQMQDLMDMFDEGNLELVEVHHSTTATDPREDELKLLANNKRTAKRLEGSSIASARAQEVISLYHLRVKQ